MTQLAALSSHLRTQLATVLVGQNEAVDQLLVVLLCGGHALLEGAPGLAKTLMAKSLGHICRLQFQRVQCTADLMPADITGTSVFNLASNRFELHRGPIFTDLLLVDEINRTSPRTQAALLEAMEERQVTLDGQRHDLGPHFTVLATQNPIEFQGTYPLPEAQLDRFLLKIRVAYPSAAEELEILRRAAEPGRPATPTFDPLPTGWLEAARAELAAFHVQPELLGYIATLIRRTRDFPPVALGASPRAGLALFHSARAFAAIDGRSYLLPDDVKRAAHPVLRHRLILRPEADLEGLSADLAIDQILHSVEVPR